MIDTKIIKLTTILLCMQATVLVAQENKPNIIIILADDLGWGDLGYNGSSIKTPVIDQLSQEGIRLNRFYTAAVCSPTRAGLITGRHPDRFGLRETVIPPWSKFGVNTDEVFMPEYLVKAGYKNRAIIGKWHLGHSSFKYHPLYRGFTHFYGHLNGAIDYFTHKREGELDWHNDFKPSYDQGYTTDLLADEAVKNITQYSKEGPFFMYLAFNAPHGPFQAKEEDLLEYPAESDPKRKTYAAMVSNLDKNIGKVLQTLKTLNIEDNTIVLFFSDNGYAPDSPGSSGELKGSKFTEWEGGVHAPAIIKWPAKLTGGHIVEQVTGYIDVLPTLLDIVGFEDETKNPLDGISIYPVLRGTKTSISRDFYLGGGALVNKDFKLIEAGHNSRMNLQDDVLFNIPNDISEATNLKETRPANYTNLKTKLAPYKSIVSSEQVPPFEEGREAFSAPKEWQIKAGAYDAEHTAIMLADPTIYHHEGTYYLYGTGVNNKTNQGFVVYTSTDLKNWSGTSGPKDGYALKKGDAFGVANFMAPQVFKYNNKFYMAYSADENIALASSDSPLGPFTQQIKTPLFQSGRNIDPYLFIDDDGKKYLYYVVVEGGQNRIFVAEMENNLSAVRLQTIVECISTTSPWENIQSSITEGPTVVKQNGIYFLLYSANHFENANSAVGYATSTSPTGPWTKFSGNPILGKEHTGVNGPSRGDLFKDANDDWKYVFQMHYSNGSVGPRQVALADALFSSNGQKITMNGANSYLLKRTIYFKQDFNMSTNLTDYIGLGGNQFDGLSFLGNSSINTLNNKLRIIKNGGSENNKTGAAKTDNRFNPGGTGGFIKFAMDVTVSNNTTNIPKGFRVSLGATICCTTPGSPNDVNIHSDLYINPTVTPGIFFIQGGPSNAVVSSQPLFGTQKLVWYINNSGKALGYIGPDGMSSNVENDAADIWAIDGLGTAILVLDEVPATSPTVEGIRTFKISSDANFVSTLDIDNMVITEESQIAVTDFVQRVNYGRISAFDYDSDGDLDLIIGGSSGGVGNVQLYTNNGGGVFTPVSSPLTGLVRPTYDWNDINQDGNPDIIQNGFLGSTQTAGIFNSDGNGTFIANSITLPQSAPSSGFADFNNDGYLDIFVFGNGIGSKILLNNSGNGYTESTLFGNYHFVNPSVSVVDYDNDRDLDLFITATINGESFSKLFVNTNGIFAETTISGLLAKGNGSSTWGDYDGDGFPDLLLNGDGSASSGETINNYRLYRNGGDGTFTVIETFNYRQNFTSNGGRFLDWDNDGDLDIVMTGWSSSQNRQATDIYINNNGVFTPYTANTSIPGVSEGSVEIGDVNNDGNLDLLIAGFSANNWDGLGGANKHAAFVMQNPSNHLNTAPDTPKNLNVTGSEIFSWTASTDDTTPQQSLTYNFFLVDANGKWFYYPLSDTTSGKTKIARIGNVQYNTGWIVKNLPEGIYRWGVQAIDNSYKGSAFAKGSFTVESNEVLPVTMKEYNVSNVNDNVLVKWKVLSETNVDKYIVEHSENGKLFKEVAQVPARNNGSLNEYSVTHYNPINGTNYYRLNSVDNDAKKQVFDVLALNYKLSQKVVSVYPNPLKLNEFNLRLEGYQGEITVKIIDSQGRVLETKIIKANLDVNTYKVLLSQKPVAGLYIVSLSGEMINKTTSLVVN